MRAPAGLALVVLLGSTAAVARPVPQNPNQFLPYLTLPANGAAVAWWDGVASMGADFYTVRAQVNGAEVAPVVAALGSQAIRIGAEGLTPGDVLSVHVAGGEIELPFFSWTVVAADATPPAFASEPVVLSVGRPVEDPSSFTPHDPEALIVRVAIDVADDHEVVGIGVRRDGADVDWWYPRDELSLVYREPARGVSCFELVAADAAGHEAATEVCVPAPSTGLEQPPEGPDDDEGDDDGDDNTAPDAPAPRTSCASVDAAPWLGTVALGALIRGRRRPRG